MRPMADDEPWTRREMSRVYRVSCKCGEETTLLLGAAEDFADEQHVRRSAVRGSRSFKEEPGGNLVCEKCGSSIVIARRPHD
jgi:hypothetical protein